MKRPIRIKDIAEAAGVSTGTVDRVIHGRGNVSPAKRAKVLEVMRALDYKPNIIASALAYNKNFRIGVLLPDPEIDPYWQAPYSGVTYALESVRHYGVTVQFYLFDLFKAETFVEQYEKLLADAPDAILFSPLFLKESKALLAKSSALGIPNVMVNTYIENSDSLSYIGPDSYQSGVLAARLLNFGLNNHATVIILNLAKGSTNAQHLLQKEQGFRDYYANFNSGSTTVVKYDFEDFDKEELMEQFMEAIFRKHPDLDGVFVTNSRAFRVVESISAEAAKRLKIVGFDLMKKNLDYLQTGKIDFIINQNSVQQGYWGIMTLFNHFILKQKVEKIQNLPLDIVVLENYSYYLRKEKSFQLAI